MTAPSRTDGLVTGDPTVLGPPFPQLRVPELVLPVLLVLAVCSVLHSNYCLCARSVGRLVGVFCDRYVDPTNIRQRHRECLVRSTQIFSAYPHSVQDRIDDRPLRDRTGAGTARAGRGHTESACRTAACAPSPPVPDEVTQAVAAIGSHALPGPTRARLSGVDARAITPRCASCHGRAFTALRTATRTRPARRP